MQDDVRVRGLLLPAMGLLVVGLIVWAGIMFGLVSGLGGDNPAADTGTARGPETSERAP